MPILPSTLILAASEFPTDRQLIIIVGGIIVTTAIIFNRKIYVKVKNTEATVGGTDRQLNGRTLAESTVSQDVKEIREAVQQTVKQVEVLRSVVSSLHGTELERIDKINKRLDVLSSRHERLDKTVGDDRHALQNTLGLIVLSTHEIKAKLDNPTLVLPVVDIAKGIERIQRGGGDPPSRGGSS